jgi:hypothetical protein
MGRKFTKCRENFVCEHCGMDVVGNGYTNHCPFCLYSKHVDINPGDRSNKCEGLMKPVLIESKGGNSVIVVQKCLKCGVVKRIRAADNDSFDVVVAIIKGVEK